ncbi:MAG: hypothetical protein AAGJ87_08410, partial [Pseudomonadota bacterium]
MPDPSPIDAARALLRWYVDMGVDETVGAAPSDFFAETPPSPQTLRDARPQTASTQPRAASADLKSAGRKQNTASSPSSARPV